MKIFSIFAFFISFLFFQGCVLTKIITVPLRVGGAIISVIPIAGNAAHDAIDEAAEIIDEAPI